MLISDSAEISSNPEVIDLTKIEGPLTVTITPGAACTAKLEVSYNNKRSWSDWAPGVVNTTTPAVMYVGEIPTHIKATRVSGSNPCFVTVSR